MRTKLTFFERLSALLFGSDFVRVSFFRSMEDHTSIYQTVLPVDWSDGKPMVNTFHPSVPISVMRLPREIKYLTHSKRLREFLKA